MKKRYYPLLLVGVLSTLLTACQSKYTQASFNFPEPIDTASRPTEKQERKTYTFAGVYADNQFSAARLNDFYPGDTVDFIAKITPENKPINPSPWFAFRLWADEAKTIRLTLDYEDAKHRYQPKISTDSVNWRTIPDSLVQLNEDSTAASFDVAIGQEKIYLAAQEIRTISHVRDWCERQAAHPQVDFSSVGLSVEERSIFLLDMAAQNKADKEIVVILSRQHPPEVSGYLAMEAFVEALLEDNKLANDFRKKYHILVFPLVNPDGVHHGHWRHNLGGIDLNRDWQYHRQPEVRTVTSYLAEQARRKNSKGIILSLDFHSTFRDIFYTPENPSETLPYFKDYWIDGITQTIDSLGFDPNDSPGLPRRPTSAAWIMTQFNAEGITYEVGDRTPRDFIRRKAQIAAAEMMQLLVLR